MSAMLVPGTPVQISCTTELLLAITWMSTIAAERPTALLAVRAVWKSPASVGVPTMAPETALKFKPGGRPLAVKPSGEFAAVTVKLNGWPRNAIADNELVMAVGAGGVFVGNKRLLGMI